MPTTILHGEDYRSALDRRMREEAEFDNSKTSATFIALARLLAQCDRLRLPGQPESDAEKNARAIIDEATGAA